MRDYPVWNPCSQMKDHENFPLVEVIKTQGSHIYLNDGRILIDAISSWWCKSLGHQHPKLNQALMNQLNKFEHVILAGTTNKNIENLSKKLTEFIPSLTKVFYASDGSSAVEIAMKMSLHARNILGESQRKEFLTLENSYHGETIATLSVSDNSLYQEPYRHLMFDTPVIKNIPYVHSIHDPVWNNCDEQWKIIQAQLEQYKDTTTAILIEPLLQGAGGMKIYSQDFLKKIRTWTNENNIHLIADEIATGFGRTGKMFACEYAHIEPDFLCLGKGLTGGYLPLSAMLTTQNIYDLFYDDYATGKSFLHSHTHSGNALAVAVALEVLNVYESENILEKANALGSAMLEAMQAIANQTGALMNVRQLGAMVAADLCVKDPKARIGYEVYKRAMKQGALLRPLGNTIYWLPPLNMSDQTLDQLKRITCEAVRG